MLIVTYLPQSPLQLPDKVPEDLIVSLTDKLWTSLVVLDDLSASTSSIITLLAELLKHKHICE